MQFRTDFSIPKADYSITHKDIIITAGSCFAEVIGSRLYESKFRVNTNPFGTLFNPLSLEKLLISSLNNTPLPSQSYIKTRDLWFNYFLHSGIYATTKEELEEKTDKLLNNTGQQLKAANYLILTLGTAYVYRNTELDETVANCHKMSQSLFSKELLKPEEIITNLNTLFASLHKINPGLKIILTVSPVRHIKDSLPLNSVSKSILRYASHILQSEFDFVSYFPAYELILDDLRDYRFYKEDMIHPTTQAESYIWEKFSNSFFNADSLVLIKKWEQLKKSLAHKPLQSHSSDYKIFINNTLTRLTELSNHLPLQEEIDSLKQKLNTL